MKFNEFVEGKEIIEKAKEFATKKHKGQMRKFTGAPYIDHPAAVAALVDKYGGNPEMVAAAWLHDVVEDCGVKIIKIKDKFGPNVAKYVQELTIPPSVDKGDKKTEHIAKKLTKMSDEGLTIKLCDRLNNVSDFESAHPNFVSRYTPKTKYILDTLEASGRPLDRYQKMIVDEIRKAIEPYDNSKYNN